MSDVYKKNSSNTRFIMKLKWHLTTDPEVMHGCTCFWLSRSPDPYHQCRIPHTTRHDPTALSCILARHTHLNHTENISTYLNDAIIFAFIISFVIKIQFLIKIVTFLTNGQMFYLLHKTGMMNGWHQLPRKQGQPLPQTSSVKTRFHSLHPHSHCR